MIAVVALAASCSGCSKSVKGKKRVAGKAKSEFSDRRRPRDNAFIQEGGYSKKSKVNPFAANDVNKPIPQSQDEEKVVYEKEDAKPSKAPAAAAVSPVAYNTGKMEPKRNPFKALFTKIASIFSSKTPKMTQVASNSKTYRPMINKMVLDGGIIPNHNDLIEQGSFDDGYNIDEINMDPITAVESKPMLMTAVLDKPLARSKGFNKVKKPFMKKAVVTSPKIFEPTVMPLVADAVIENKERRLEKSVISTIAGLVNISKALYGISADKAEEDFPVVDIPDIEDADLKNRSGEKQNLSDIPPIPKEFSTQES